MNSGSSVQITGACALLQRDAMLGQQRTMGAEVAAAEAAIGLAILTIFFKKTSSISIDNISKLKG